MSSVWRLRGSVEVCRICMKVAEHAVHFGQPADRHVRVISKLGHAHMFLSFLVDSLLNSIKTGTLCASSITILFYISVSILSFYQHLNRLWAPAEPEIETEITVYCVSTYTFAHSLEKC